MIVALLFSVSTSARQLFYSSEHMYMGDTVNFFGNFTFEKRETVNFGGGGISYGDAVAACGDYSMPDGQVPVCNGKDEAGREDRFTQMFNGLTGIPDVITFREGIRTDDSLAEFQNNVQLNYADHFAPTVDIPGSVGNWDAYSAGHRVATKMAAACNSEAGIEKQHMCVKKALIANACASHYLSDMFAAGHIRTPYQAITDPFKSDAYWSNGGPLMLPGILLLGHGFDNMAGLNVRNRLGEEWIAYGDQCAFANKENDFFSGNDENRKRHNMVLQASAQEVVDAYVTNNPKTVSSTVWNNVPDWELAQHLNASFTMGNAAPAIRAKRGTATPLWELRKDYHTLDDAWEWDFEDIGNTENARKWSRTATLGGAALSGALYCGSHTLALAKKEKKTNRSGESTKCSDTPRSFHRVDYYFWRNFGVFATLHAEAAERDSQLNCTGCSPG